MSVIRYPGGKSRKSIRNLIISYIPQDVLHYREPFCGGAGVAFGLEKSRFQSIWINDINEHLISVFLALRDRPDQFIAKCREIPIEQEGEEQESTKGTGKKYNARLKRVFDSFKYNEEMDQALRYFFINRTVWAGRVTYDKAMSSRMYYSNPSGWNITTTDRMERTANAIKGFNITSVDYSELFNDQHDTLLYCDAPYLVDTNFNSGSKLYQYGFTKEDHIRFAELCSKSNNRIIISYDDNEFIRDLFSGFFIYEHEWTYSGTTNSKKKTGKELIICNFQKETNYIL